MLPWLLICPHCQRFPITKTMLILWVTIRRTWAGPMVQPTLLEPNWILLEAICQKDGAAQL
jgi:hypothetical protein